MFPTGTQPTRDSLTIEDVEEVIYQQVMDTSVSHVTSKMVPTTPTPYVRLVEQPASRALRFRYECEGRSAGSIPGANSTAECKTYPTIQVVNYKGSAVVVVSCVTKEGPPFRPHPHNLVGREGCKKGICTMVINNHDMTCSFSSLGIQCVKRKDIEESLKLREMIKVDPYRTGFDHRLQTSNIDLNVVRLCFQVFIEGPQQGKYTVPLPPVVSDPIFDKKAICELTINKLSHYSAPVCGGSEVILLCDKVAKDDIKVRFYEERAGRVEWESFGEFHPNEVHKQVAIPFRTPRYRDENVQQPIPVFIQLYRPSDGSSSDPRPFQLLPVNRDPEGLSRKRQKIEDGCLDRFLKENIFGAARDAGGPLTPHTIPRTIKQATRTVLKPETVLEGKSNPMPELFLQPSQLPHLPVFTPELRAGATSGGVVTVGVASTVTTCSGLSATSIVEHQDRVGLCSPFYPNTTLSTASSQDILAIATKQVSSIPKSEPSSVLGHQSAEMSLEETTEKLDSLDLGIEPLDIQNILDYGETGNISLNLSQSLFDSGNNLPVSNMLVATSVDYMNASTNSFSFLQSELETLNVLCKSRTNEST